MLQTEGISNFIYAAYVNWGILFSIVAVNYSGSYITCIAFSCVSRNLEKFIFSLICIDVAIILERASCEFASCKTRLLNHLL